MNISRRGVIRSTAAGAVAATAARFPSVVAQDSLPTIKVGSRTSTEQLLMGELVAQLAESGGYSADRIFSLGGTLVTHEAITSGDLHTYVEYTGSGLVVVLGMDIPDDGDEGESGAEGTPVANRSRAQHVYDIVSERYREELNIEWLEPFGFNNAYAMAMRREHAEELGLTKVSELAPIAHELTLGSDAETMVREDGVVGLEEAYDFEFGSKVSLDSGLTYMAAHEGEVDVITAFSTDGRIQAMDLVLLEDDLEFFPPYWAAPIVRQDTLEENPDLREVLNQMAGKIDDARMVEMNYLADSEGMEHAEIVRNLLIEEGIVEG